MARALDQLTFANANIVRDLAMSADMVRGYEGVKLRNVAAYRSRVDELVASIESLPRFLNFLTQPRTVHYPEFS